jgi:hypothetical protein
MTSVQMCPNIRNAPRHSAPRVDSRLSGTVRDSTTLVFGVAELVRDRIPTLANGAVNGSIDEMKGICPADNLGAQGSTAIGTTEWD